jgi:hypothetical protein
MALTNEDKPWHGLEFEIAEELDEMFRTCTKFEIVNRDMIYF